MTRARRFNRRILDLIETLELAAVNLYLHPHDTTTNEAQITARLALISYIERRERDITTPAPHRHLEVRYNAGKPGRPTREALAARYPKRGKRRD